MPVPAPKIPSTTLLPVSPITPQFSAPIMAMMPTILHTPQSCFSITSPHVKVGLTCLFLILSFLGELRRSIVEKWEKEDGLKRNLLLEGIDLAQVQQAR